MRKSFSFFFLSSTAAVGDDAVAGSI